jgi:hypothetical protein
MEYIYIIIAIVLAIVVAGIGATVYCIYPIRQGMQMAISKMFLFSMHCSRRLSFTFSLTAEDSLIIYTGIMTYKGKMIPTHHQIRCNPLLLMSQFLCKEGLRREQYYEAVIILIEHELGHAIDSSRFVTPEPTEEETITGELAAWDKGTGVLGVSYDQGTYAEMRAWSLGSYGIKE